VNSAVQSFFNSTPGTTQAVVLFIAPFCQRQSCRRLWITRRLVLMMLFSFCILSAAVLAEPTITQVKEVSGLMHTDSELCTSMFALCPDGELIKERSTKLQTCSAGQRRAAGESINLTGTLVRLPSRSI
jgi:hypothetical protein